VGDDVGLWVNISELAKLRHRDKGVISRRVARLEAQGLLKTKAGDRGTKLVNVAEFDRATEEATDAVRELNGSGAVGGDVEASAAAPGNPVLAKEQARRASYAADNARLDLEERLGRLVPAEDVLRFHEQMVDAVKRITAELPTRAEEMGATVAKDGFTGGRNFLRRLGRELDEAFADAMDALAARLGRPEEDAA
jgi:DNA-binding MarR family transcriptional regulator